MARSEDLRVYPSSMFQPEPLAIPVVARPRLLSQITGPDARQVTVIAAPLGYGKTVLLTQAYAALTQQGRSCLWLSADKASRGDLPDLLWSAADHAAISRPRGAPITLDRLLTRIEGCGETVSIFIDGLNRHRPQAAALWPLIRGASHGVTFVLATETDLPLPQLRLEAAGRLRRIGDAALAFDSVDIAALDQPTSLCDGLSTLNACSEGWPAIVQLALGRCRDCPDLASSPLSAVRPDIATFLEYEVLGALDRNHIAALRTASVAERICGALLDALSGSSDGAAMLNLLLGLGVPMQRSPSGEWFRLHPLMRDHLYDQLRRRDADRLALLHRRAATWLLTFGDEQAALCHGTASGDIDFLRTIYQAPDPTRALSPGGAGRSPIADADARTIPDLARQTRWRDILRLIQAGRIDLARGAIAKMQPPPTLIGSDPSEDRAVEWEQIYIDLLMRVFDDRLPRPGQLETLRDRLMRTPGVPLPVPAAVSELVIVSRFRSGDLSEGAQADPNRWHTSALGPPQSKIYLLIELGIAAIELGDLDRAERHLCDAKTLAIDTFGPEPPHAHAASTVLAELALERGEHAASARQVQNFGRMQPEEVWFNLAASAFTTSSAAAARRSWHEALASLELPQSLAGRVGLWRLPPLLIAQRLRLAILWGHDLEAARSDRDALRNLGLLDPGEDSAAFGWRVTVPAQLAAIRFDLADRRADEALARAMAERPALEARRHVRRLIELDLLQGRAASMLGQHDAGVALVRAALSLAADSGMVQNFLDELRFIEPLIGDLLLAADLSARDRAFLHQLLTRLERPPMRSIRYVAGGRTIDLSSREAQVLQALASGKTFKEIAFALNISINTTKMHRTRLYRKLGCNSRSHAITMAHDLVGR